MTVYVNNATGTERIGGLSHKIDGRGYVVQGPRVDGKFTIDIDEQTEHYMRNGKAHMPPHAYQARFGSVVV